MEEYPYSSDEESEEEDNVHDTDHYKYPNGVPVGDSDDEKERADPERTDPDMQVERRPWHRFDRDSRGTWEKTYLHLTNFPLKGSWDNTENYQKEKDREMLKYLARTPPVFTTADKFEQVPGRFSSGAMGPSTTGASTGLRQPAGAQEMAQARDSHLRRPTTYAQVRAFPEDRGCSHATATDRTTAADGTNAVPCWSRWSHVSAWLPAAATATATAICNAAADVFTVALRSTARISTTSATATYGSSTVELRNASTNARINAASPPVVRADTET